MARIRTIKPQFWRSPDIMALDYFQRLLFIGLFNLADDYGRGVYNPASIAADLFITEFSLNPHGVLTEVSNAFAEYSKRSMVAVYEVENRQYFQIVNWNDHQKVNRKTDSSIPPLTCKDKEVTRLTESSLNPHGGLTPGIRKGNKEGNKERNISSSPSSDSSAQRPDARPSEYPSEFEDWWKAYPRRKNCSKKDAAKQWCEAAKTIPPERLLELTKVYAANPGTEDTRFIPHPHKWLKDRRWEAIEETDKPTTPHSRFTPEALERRAFGGTGQPDIIEAEVLPWQIEA